ncbi:GNAT family N-acetyltransferase [Eudoraea chungangensis]|uniref:GNAT family N-acetyltransferase n=1 Tax=Eudoraea chungangensis TaxID=1481905 RepID=UPI0023EDCCC4|nr:GNAT family N-acetyltransferase [Eudoraea chungangensis]
MSPTNTHVSFETDRLFLRPTSIGDASFLLELMNTPKWLQFIGDRKIETLKDAEQYIEDKILPQLNRLGYSNYTVIRKSDDIKLGSCGLYDRDGVEGVDIGFAFLPAFEKMGYAFEAANKLKIKAGTVFGIKELYGITLQENEASQILLEKLGFTFKKMTRIPNDQADLMLYHISL